MQDQLLQLYNQYEQLINIGIILILLILLRIYINGGVCRIKKDLTNKVIIITGANTGIGLESAKELAKQGATLILACRDEKRGKNAEKEVNLIRQNSAQFMKMDLSDLSSIHLFANEFKQKFNRLDILLNNAGVMSPSERELTKDGFEIQIGVNHLGHFLLTNLLLDLLKKTENSRIINVSSLAHVEFYPYCSKIHFDDINFEKTSYNRYQTYGQSKLANILFTKQLQKMFDKENLKIKSVCLHPGAIKTELLRYYQVGFMKYLFILLNPFIAYTLKTPLQGAQTNLYCCLEDFDKLQGGQFYSDCKLKKSSKRSCDMEAAQKLWDLSKKLVKL